MNSYALKTAVEKVIGNNIRADYANEGVTVHFFLYNCGENWKAAAAEAQDRLTESGFLVERKGRKSYTLNVTHIDWQNWKSKN